MGTNFNGLSSVHRFPGAYDGLHHEMSLLTSAQKPTSQVLAVWEGLGNSALRRPRKHLDEHAEQ